MHNGSAKARARGETLNQGEAYTAEVQTKISCMHMTTWTAERNACARKGYSRHQNLSFFALGGVQDGKL